MKKSVIALIFFMVMALTSCASGSGESVQMNDGALYAETAAGEIAFARSETMQAPAEAGIGVAEVQPAERQAQTKIIRNADLRMEAIDVKEAYDKFMTYAATLGGYEFSRTADVSYNGHISLTAVIKIPPAALDGATAYAEECGEVKSSNISSENITAAYVDAEIRLENKRRNLEKYYEHLESAFKMEDIISLQNQIDMLTADIEAYEGQLRLWDSLVSESTINISIYQVDDPNKPEDVEIIEWDSLSFNNMGKLMFNGFKKALNILVSVLQWILIAVVTILPVIIPAAVIVIFVIRAKRKRKSGEGQIPPVKPERKKSKRKDLESEKAEDNPYTEKDNGEN